MSLSLLISDKSNQSPFKYLKFDISFIRIDKLIESYSTSKIPINFQAFFSLKIFFRKIFLKMQMSNGRLYNTTEK
jgi:hypothetical protein